MYEVVRRHRQEQKQQQQQQPPLDGQHLPGQSSPRRSDHPLPPLPHHRESSVPYAYRQVAKRPSPFEAFPYDLPVYQQPPPLPPPPPPPQQQQQPSDMPSLQQAERQAESRHEHFQQVGRTIWTDVSASGGTFIMEGDDAKRTNSRAHVSRLNAQRSDTLMFQSGASIYYTEHVLRLEVVIEIRTGCRHRASHRLQCCGKRTSGAGDLIGRQMKAMPESSSVTSLYLRNLHC
ncbi:unnamed protein product [Sympodiomycopsis kandeliae]